MAISYQFVFEPEAIVDLDAMDTTIRQRILRKVNWLALNFEQAVPQGLSENLEGFTQMPINHYLCDGRRREDGGRTIGRYN